MLIINIRVKLEFLNSINFIGVSPEQDQITSAPSDNRGKNI